MGPPCPVEPSPFTCLSVFFLWYYFLMEQKACLELPHPCWCHHKCPILSPCHPWGWHPHCHPVLAALRAPGARPGLSCGTEINIKSWQSNEPKIQGQNKLLIAHPARTCYGTSGGLCNTLKPSRSGEERGGHPPKIGQTPLCCLWERHRGDEFCLYLSQSSIHAAFLNNPYSQQEK